jgi:hypothetical protein
MNKKVLIGAAAGVAVAGCIAAAAKKDKEQGQDEAKPTIWDKMRQGMEEMPEDFPPRLMFDNVEATKANTEQILKMLRDNSAQSEGAREEGAQRDDLEILSST